MIGDILEVIAVSLIAGVGITTAYSFVVLGSGRYAEARRAGQAVVAIGFGALAVVSLLVFLGGFVFAIQTMLSKG
jgi:hypothetical protein